MPDSKQPNPTDPDQGALAEAKAAEEQRAEAERRGNVIHHPTDAQEGK